MIQFSHKSVTKYLNFSLMICLYWRSSKYMFPTQCSNWNMKSTVGGFIYRHISRSVNLTFTSNILMISITRSWTDNDKGVIDCTNLISAMKARYIARGKIMLLSWLSPIIIFSKDIGPTTIPTSRYL